MSCPSARDESWYKATEDDLSEIANCYCPQCQGTMARTLVLPTKIPGFREVLLITLMCPDCGWKDTSTTFGGSISPTGQRLTLRVQSVADLQQRQIIKSDAALVRFSQVLDDLEIPATTQQGVLTTVEGLLKRAKDDLMALQPERLRVGDLDGFHRCQHVIDTIRELVENNGNNDDDNETRNDIYPFDMTIDDPSGNSYIENLQAPNSDPQLTAESYVRTPAQNIALGLQPSQPGIRNVSTKEPELDSKALTANAVDSKVEEATLSIGRSEVVQFATSCPNCRGGAQTAMHVHDIPHFKETVLVCLLCDHCGYRSNEIKGCGAIPRFGKRITLTVAAPQDLERDILRSDTTGVSIPEIELELSDGGAAGGSYTTVEGLLRKLHDTLEASNPFATGDSAGYQNARNDGDEFSEPSSRYIRFRKFLRRLRACRDGESFPFTLVLLDPLDNSFIGPRPGTRDEEADRIGIAGSDDPTDPFLKTEKVDRTWEQNEILGVNDIRTGNCNEE